LGTIFEGLLSIRRSWVKRNPLSKGDAPYEVFKLLLA